MPGRLWSEALETLSSAKIGCLNPGRPDSPVTNTKQSGVWRLACRCGKEFSPRLANVLNGSQVSCGCVRSTGGALPHSRVRTFGEVSETANKNGLLFLNSLEAVVPVGPHLRIKGVWEFRCWCGKQFYCTLLAILNGQKSCGCLSAAVARRNAVRARASRAKYTVGDLVESCRVSKLEPLFETGDLQSPLVDTQERKWQFRCRCGFVFSDCLNHVVRRAVSSCGCVQSGIQVEVFDFVRSLRLDAQNNNRTIIGPLELDVYVPSLKVGIELDGLHWHGERFLQDRARNHRDAKVRACQAAGIRLVVIFESEWRRRRAQVEGYLRAILRAKTSVVGARKCTVVSGGREFIAEHHLQGPSGGVHYSLVREGKILAAATLARPNASRRTDGQSFWELARFCVAPGVSVPGALPRLISAFASEHPEVPSLVTYSDNRWSKGDLYRSTGFELESPGKPSYWYFKVGSTELVHRFRWRKSVALRTYGGEGTEWDIMSRNGWDRIWDLGASRWRLNLQADAQVHTR